MLRGEKDIGPSDARDRDRFMDAGLATLNCHEA